MREQFNKLVIIPTYNEVKNIRFIIERIFSLEDNLSVLIVDDNSPDETAGIVRRLQSKYGSLYLMTREQKMGLGSAYIEGFKYAIEKNYDVIVQMDGDSSHSPEYLSGMIGLLRKYDLVIGSRYAKGGGVSNWSLLRLFLSRSANIFSKIFLRIPVEDLTSGFKCMKKEVLEKIDFSTIKSQGYAFQVEMVFRAYLKGLKIAEYPIVFKGRQKDKSKMSFGIIFEAFLRVVLLSIERVFL